MNEITIQKPTWKAVLHPNYEWHGDIDKFFMRVVLPSGYPFFIWNGRVYQVAKPDPQNPPTWTYLQREWTQEDIEQDAGADYYVDKRKAMTIKIDLTSIQPFTKLVELIKEVAEETTEPHIRDKIITGIRELDKEMEAGGKTDAT